MGFTRIGLFVRGVRFRLGALVFLLIAAIVAILGATVGPIYLGSAQNSVLIGGLRSAPVEKTGLQVDSTVPLTRKSLLAAESQVPRLGGHPLFVAPLLTADVPAVVTPPPALHGSSISASLLERTDICAHLQLVSGHCPVSSQQVLLSARSAAYLHAKVGDRLQLTPGLIGAGLPGSGRSSSYVISGTYAIPDIGTNYWWGANYFVFGSGSGSTVYLDPVVVAPGFFGGKAEFGAGPKSGFGSDLGVDRLLQMPLDPKVVTFQNYHDVGTLLTHYTSLVPTRDRAVAFSGLEGELLSIVNSQNSMATLVAVIILELVLLGLIVFGTLIWRMVQSRMGEFRLAQLRGVRTRSIILRAIGEPLVVLVVASPLGFLGAYLTVSEVGRSYFASGTKVDILPVTYLAGLAVVVAALVVTLVAAGAALRRGVLEASRSALRNRGRFRALIDVLIVVVAGVLTAQLIVAPTTGTGVDPLAGAAPAFLGAGSAIVAIALTSAVLWLARRLTRNSKRIAWYLSIRQLRARSSMLRQIIPFGIALALVVFSYSSQTVIDRHRSVVAGYEVGAGKVLTVSLPQHLGLIHAVDVADPGGHSAMAAQLYRAPSGTTLAVQASRFAHVASWPSAVGAEPATTVARELAPMGKRLVRITGGRVVLGARTVGHVPAGSQVDLMLAYFDEADDSPSYASMLLSSHLERSTFAVPCAKGGCFLDGIGYSVLSNGVGTPGGHFAIQISTLVGVRASSDPGGVLSLPWRASSGVQTSVTHRDGALTLTAYPASGGATIAIVPQRYDTYIPAIVSSSVKATLSASDVSAIGTGPINGLDGNQINIRPFLTLPTLPAVGGDASIVDLTQAELAQESVSLASDEIWLAKGAPGSIISRLQREGVVIDSVTSATARAASFANEPLGLAERLFPIAAVAGMVVVMLGLAFELLVEGRGRIPEFAAMRVLGMHRPRLILSYILEALILIVASAVAGIVAGIVGARLALPVLPEIDSGLDHLHFADALPLLGSLLLVGVIVVAGVVVGAIAASRVVGRASFDELRAGDR